MPDFIAVNLLQQLRRVGIADLSEALREVPRKIQVRLLERQAQAGDVIDWIFPSVKYLPGQK